MTWINLKRNHTKKQQEEAAKAMQVKLYEVLNPDNHKWYLNKLDPAEKAKRQKAAAEFKVRYSN